MGHRCGVGVVWQFFIFQIIPFFMVCCNTEFQEVGDCDKVLFLWTVESQNKSQVLYTHFEDYTVYLA